MDDKVWQAYEAKFVELRKKYRLKYLRTWLTWIVYYASTSTAAWLLFFERNVNVLIYFFIVNTLFPLFLTMRHIGKLRTAKEKERRALVENAPMGNFQLH